MTQRLLDTLARRAVSWISLLVAIVGGAVLAALLLFRSEYISSSNQAVRDLEDTRRTFLEFRSTLGYGGFIHDFKNYVLRGTPTYLTRADADMQRVVSLWLEVQGKISGLYTEKSTVTDMLNNYAQSVQIAKETPRESAEALDELVKVDDKPAFAALQTIDDQILADLNVVQARRSGLIVSLALWLELSLFMMLVGLLVYLFSRTARSELAEITATAARNRQLFADLTSEKDMLSLQQDQAERMGGFGTWLLNLDTGEISWSEGVYAIHGRPAGRGVPSLEEAGRYYAPEARQALAFHVQKAAEARAGFTLRFDLTRDDGTRRHVASSGQYAEHSGHRYLVGVFRDLTAYMTPPPSPAAP